MNTIRKRQNLYDDNICVGYTITTYDIKMIEEFEENSYTFRSEQPKQLKFFLKVSQRVIYFNEDSIQLPIKIDEKNYLNYPVILNSQLNVQVIDGVDVSIIDYSPKVINTEINKTESSSNAKGETIGSTKSSTTGTTVSASVRAGYGGLTGGHADVSASLSHEWSNTESNEHSNTTNKENSLGSSMSVADWGSYASINTLQSSQKGITWYFGQQNPWNALIYRKSSKEEPDSTKEVQLALPNYLTQKLIDNGTVLPPSGLSLNGFDFIMEGTFLIKISNPNLESITVNHVFKLAKASHKLEKGEYEKEKVNVYRDQTLKFLRSQEGCQSLDMEIFPSLLSLKPIGKVFSSAIVGFYRKSFDLSPIDSTGFKIRSFENDLLIKSPEIDRNSIDSSYSLLQNALCLTLREKEISFDIFFKIADLHKNYNLIIKHWIQDKQDSPNHTGVSLRFIINEDEDCTIVKQVNDKLQEGGESNILSLSLRNLDYTTIDFHNYLKIGLNKISVFAKKPENCEEIRYLINAISVVSSN